jgi:hypothetical protein
MNEKKIDDLIEAIHLLIHEMRKEEQCHDCDKWVKNWWRIHMDDPNEYYACRKCFELGVEEGKY